jgi:MarR family transcriptional regulator, transcriptional regulator for hemolysin
MQEDPIDRVAIERSPSRAINRASRLLIRRFDQQLGAFGFSHAQLPVLLALAAGQPLSQKQLAEAAHTEQPAMAEMLARMEHAGIVKKQPDPDDGRARLFRLSRGAANRLPKAFAASGEVLDLALRGVTKAEANKLVELLERMITNLLDD